MAFSRPVAARTRRMAASLLCAVLVATTGSVPAQQLPSLGGEEMSTAAERKLGEKIARELYRDPDYIDDPVLVEYVQQQIWEPLLRAARVRGDIGAELDERFAWQVLLGKDRSVNAFALPGGWLGLHLGLVAITTSKDELAAVLAHELSHVSQRHISRLVSQQNRQTPLLIGAMILGALAASKSPDAANALITGGQALAMQNQLNFSRDMEREADRVGYAVLVQAGFETQAFVSMFDKLQQSSRLNDSGAFPYLRSHPLTTERMADMQSRQQLSSRPAPVPITMLHAIATGRARVLSNSNVDALRAQLAEVEGGAFANQTRSRQAGALYSAAFAASRLRDAAGAQRLLARLEPVASGDPASQRLVRLLAAEIALQFGDVAKAQTLLPAQATARPELLVLSELQVQTGQAAAAAQALQTWVVTNPRDATAWQWLARAYAAQGQALRSVRAEAEARVAQLDYPAAMDRFKAAQDLARRGRAANDHIEASIVDTRTRQVELLLREQALER